MDSSTCESMCVIAISFYARNKKKWKRSICWFLRFTLSAYIDRARRKLAFDAAFTICNDEEYDMPGKAHK